MNQTIIQPKKSWIGGFGRVLCLKCGKQGYLSCTVRNGSFYWHVDHKSGIFNSKKLNHTSYVISYVIDKKHLNTASCNFGRIDDDKLDEILQNRPFPLTSIEARNVVERKLDENIRSQTT